MRTGRKLGALIVALCAVGLAPGAARAEPVFCKQPRAQGDLPQKVSVKPVLRYPKGQLSMLGEGWVRLGYKIRPDGGVEGIWVIDIVGAPIFAHAAATAMRDTRFEPLVRGGEPVEANHKWEFDYRVEGKNRAGVHAKIGNDYDAAQAARSDGDYRRSVEILKGTQQLVLTLYEYAITAYGLTVSYRGLSDRRRALLHVRHAAMSDGAYADRGQRKSAFALLAELAIQDHSYREGLCAYERLKEKYPDYVPTPQLQELITAAERELAAATPTRTEVELIESGRDDVPTMWRHELLRPTVRIEAVQGALKSVRVLCPTSTVEESAPVSRAITVDQPAGACDLYVFGDPGAKFVLDER